MKHIKNEQGFTLLEMIFVLFIVMCLTGIVTKLSMKVSEAKEIEHFFTQLQLDIHFTQMVSIERKEYFFIRFDGKTKSYSINDYKNEVFYERNFPKNTELLTSLSTLVLILYNENGNVSKAGTIYFKTPYGNKKVVITLGVGRVRVE